MKTTLLYFAYGSNLLTERLVYRIASARFHSVIELPGWRMEFAKRGDDGSAKCTLLEDSEATTPGVIFEMSMFDLPKLDRIEGKGAGYDRLEVRIPNKDDAIRAYTYAAQDGWIEPELKPFDWYHALVLAGAREHGLPSEHIARIESELFEIDQDAERRAHPDQILSTAR